MRRFLVIIAALFAVFSGAVAQPFLRTFNTVSELLESNPNVVHTNVTVLGFESPNDGGGGDFYYSRTSAEQVYRGVVLKPNTSNGRWIAIHNGEIDARRFGAKQDNSTDSAAALNDAFLWGARNKVSILLKGGGTFRTGSRLVIHSNQSIIGDKRTTISADYTGSTSDMYYSILSNTNLFTGLGPEPRTSVAPLATNIFLSGLRVTAANNLCNARGVVLIGVHDVSIEDCEVVRTYDAWAFTFFAKNLRTRGLKVSENSELFEDGIHVLGGENQKHEGFEIQSGDDSLAVGWDSSDIYAKDIVFANGSVDSKKAFGIKIFSPSVATVPIERIVYSGIVGKAGSDRNGAIMFHEQGTPSGRITNITVQSVSLAAAQGSHSGVNPYGLWVIGGADLRFNNVSISGSSQYQVIVDGAKGPIKFSNCSFKTPGASFETVYAQNCYGNALEFDGCRIVNTTQRAIRMIESDLAMRGSTIYSGPSMHVGFQFATNNTRSISLLNNWFYGSSTVPVQTTGAGTQPQRFLFNGNLADNTGSTFSVTPGSYYSVVGNSGFSTMYDEITRLSANTLTTAGFTGTGSFTVSNTAPVLSVVAANGTSGARLDVTGGSSVLFRIQEGGATRYNFGSGSDRGITLGVAGGEAAPPDSYLNAASATGTDASGADLIIRTGKGTGNSTLKGRLKINTPDATISGSTTQTDSTKWQIKRAGQMGIFNTSSDPSIDLSDGDVWYRQDTDKFRVRYNGTTANLATEDWVSANFTGGSSIPTSRLVATQHSLTGGGDLSADRTLSLVNDTASPGANKVYGTDASGVKGWKNDPAGSGGGDALVANPLSQFAATTSAQLAGVLSNESGTGLAVFNDGSALTNATINGIDLRGTAGSTINIGTGGTLGTAAYTATSAYQAADGELSAIAGLTSAADTLPYFSGSGTASTTSLTSAGRTLIGGANAAAQRTSLGLVIGTDVQAFDADLSAVAGLSTSGLVARTGAGTAASRSITGPAAGITVSNGDGAAGNPTIALANDLSAVEGLSGTGIARRTGTDTWSVGTTVSIAEGGTGQTSAKAAFDALNGAEATVASATTTDIGAASSDKVSITGTTTITGFGTATAGIRREGRFTGALLLTHNATSLILPGGASITTAAGDRFTAYSLGSGNWVVTSYTTASRTGTGADVQQNSPNFTGSPQVNGNDIGTLDILQNSQSANYTLVLGDRGKQIFHPSSDANSRTFTIPANASVAFPIGSTVTFINASANSCTIAITTDTLRKAGTGTTGSVTLPQHAVATITKVTTTEWYISGNGI